MKPKILYADIAYEVTTDNKDSSVLDISIKNKIPHLHECGGNGDCTSCRIRILEGMENLSTKSNKEIQMAEHRAWGANIRLACQSYVKGNVKLQRLVRSSAEINKLQKETILEGKAKELPIAILFCDLRNYTQFSSSNSSVDNADMLDQYYTALSHPILMNNGIIYQYVGDEIVGVFGIDGDSEENNCMNAVRAAIGMQQALEQLNQSALKTIKTKLEMGIGINFGKAYVGHLGHPTFRQFSVVGDPVNVASRIQGQTKLKKAKILLSQNVYKHIQKEALDMGQNFTVKLSGKEDSTRLFELKGFKTMDLQLELQASLNLILQDEEAFSELFYDKVFQKAPFVRALFKCNMKDQGKSLTHMLNGIVHGLARPEYLVKGLKRLGENHHGYGVEDEFYPVVKEAMLETIPEILDEGTAPQMIEAWSKAMDLVIDTMKSWKQPLSSAS